ncbi:MAG: hypothetical protein KAS66_00010 [Candidatus Omnitrophica bacterium]|nr:hypothetical protein [Candidatus Omnitrophota bacterium]
MSSNNLKTLTKADKRFYDEIKSALKEKDVENTYRSLFRIALPEAQIKSYCKTDGILISPYPEDYEYSEETVKDLARKLVALLEFKHGYDFENSYDDVISGLIQSLYYLKNCKEIENDHHTPRVIFVGDQNAGFCIGTDVLEKYLTDNSINWSFAPSSAAVKNPELFKKLRDDEEIIPYHFKINRSFKFSDIILKMFKFDEGNLNKMPISIDNIDSVFKEFKENVLKEKGLITHQEVSLFMNILLDTDSENNFLREDKSLYYTSVNGIEKVKVNVKRFKSFFNHYQDQFTLKEKDNLVKICDRLIEDENRRREGAFFTPTAWVNEAHRIIESELGEDWRDEYVVWDCCSGTGNLTRDYEFKELYCSTLLQEELDIMDGNDINPKAEHFKYDFLDLDKATLDRLKGKKQGNQALGKFFRNLRKDEDILLPELLLKSLEENKKIVFFINPPYGTAKNMKTSIGDHKSGIADSSINELMKADGIGAASQQLYAQFLYRIILCREKYNLDNVVIATFAPELFLSGPAFGNFRNKFLNEFEYKSGMLFQASHFSDVSKEWGVSFTMWKNGESENKNEFVVDLKDIRRNEIESIGTKIIYNLDASIKASDWVREETKRIKSHKNCIQMKSALNPNLDGNLRGSDIKGSIGYFHNNANNIYYNPQFVGLYSSVFSGANGLPILSSNYKKCVSLFTARKTISNDWINHVDEYSAPDVSHPDYEQWNNDAIVYSLFNPKSQQSSLRDIQLKDKSWDIKNEFFWLSRQKMLELGEKYHFDALQRDIENDTERFIHEEMQSIELSPDAQELLDKATELVEKSFEYRKELNRLHPKYNLQCWDAGWYQIKIILKEYMPDDLKEFSRLYKAFEDRMREGVFKFGFLRE